MTGGPIPAWTLHRVRSFLAAHPEATVADVAQGAGLSQSLSRASLIELRRREVTETEGATDR